MKRGAIGCWVLAVILAISNVAAAQSPPTAATVLANVQQFYANTQQLTASFRQTVTNATFNTTKTTDGRLWVAKPSSFRWDYSAARQGGVVFTKNFIFDGTTLWAIDHNAKQILVLKPETSAVPAVTSFFTGGDALTSQFTVALDASGMYGTRDALVLKLTPKQPSSGYSKLFFVVDPADWHVTETVIVDSSGNASRFSFYRPDTTTAVKPSWFQVNLATLAGYRLTKP